MFPTILLWSYCLIVASAALMGSRLPYLVRLTHRRMQFMMSFVGGLMLGVALLHMLPHAVHAGVSVDRALGMCLLGVLAMFVMIRVFHVHQHAHEPPEKGCEHEHAACGHDHEHDHAHGHDHNPLKPGASKLSWLGLAIGLALHTLIDGMALAAAVQADAEHHGPGFSLLGVGTFLAVCLHKPLDSLSITMTMMSAGWSRRSQWMAGFAFATMCPLGALLFALGVSQAIEAQHVVVGLALAFSGGVFLCISLADLLPEVTFHSHDRLLLTTVLILGIALAYGIGFIEPEHLHQDHGPGQNHSHSHDHAH